MVAHAKPKTGSPQPRFTPQEYLEREGKAETKSEYYDGVIVAMAGASPEHNMIVFDLASLLGGQMRGKRCQGFASDLRVRVPKCNCYYYPDLIVTCEEPKYETLTGLQSLLNPALIIEVLSESTAATDRGEKLDCYRTLESLQTYVMVSQEKPAIHIYRRQEKDWSYSPVEGLESVIMLEAIGCELNLADVYARISFVKPSDEEPAKLPDAREVN